MDEFLLQINAWMVSGTLFAALGCFLWGMVSVLMSPCHLASIPLIVGYVGGQQEPVKGRRAALFAVLFSVGLFITIAAVGMVCALLGRMLGDISPYWMLLPGLVLLWVAADMLDIVKCSMPNGSLLSKLQVKGASGAFVIGLAYGVVSGSCTFGFIAPILAIITVQQELVIGVMLISLFALGHCLPIAVAGGSTARIQQLLASSSYERIHKASRKVAAVLIAGLGGYFIVTSFN
ncbi:thiol:disulfide interchange protein DsbD precursor [Mariprofundus micogutta]|uniref:Thiol:disulfide interchange protein DsbD n=1 Tax=Mariprofundus micogutta TaxID=1921010 RepID=A0A1L8CMK5_9PROT|nr:cytochrome c biogenesis protein CcdA [Mariprofundus micogutta]GAV20134.1 thiol:disulfide interchange protein DsbD precursor [Mariprofundus micogutta]